MRNEYLFLDQFSYGLTDHISLGATVVTVPILLPSLFSVKFSAPYRSGKGSGALYFGYLTKSPLFTVEQTGLDNPFVIFAVNTWGTRDNQLTIGTGRAFIKNAGNDQNMIYSASYLWRWNGKWALLTDNYFIRTHTGFTVPVTVGLRFFGRIAHIDFGLGLVVSKDLVNPPTLFTPETSVSIPFPCGSFSFPFVRNVKNSHSRK